MKLLPLAALVLPLLALPLGAQSTIRVPADQPTIQAAIDVAVNGDTVLVSPGTWSSIDFTGKAITVTSESGAAVTSIQGTNEKGVYFVNGEGIGSVLSGFTVSGEIESASGPAPADGLGIYCPSATPYVIDCVIEGCNSYSPPFWYGIGGAVHGNPVLERCTLRNNLSVWGGGVYGAPTMIDCLVESNWSVFGGGLRLTDGAHIQNCTIRNNTAGPNSSRYGCFNAHGGGIYAEGGAVTVEGCVITGNEVWTCAIIPGDCWGTGAPGYGGGVYSDTSNCTLTNCTIADNFWTECASNGGVYGQFTATSCIVWDNADPAGYYTLNGTFTYSDAPGLLAAGGNIDAPPLFVGSGDYHLQPASPCIDTGDPAAPLDPDFTCTDMGALFYNHFPASTVLRPGSGVNPHWYTSTSEPILGESWTAAVDTTSYFGASLTGVYGFAAPSVPYTLWAGEVLVDAASPLWLTSFAAPVAGHAAHANLVPLDPILLGLPVYTQAVVVGSSPQLTNGIDLLLGV